MRLPAGRTPLLVSGSVVALVVAAYMTFRDDSPAGVAVRTSNRVPATTARQAGVPVVDVKLELLKDPRVELVEAERNPFRFRPRPAPLSTSAPETRPVPIAPPVPTGPPPLPPIGLRFIGLVDAPTQGGRVAIMSDGRGNVFYGKEGDIIEGRYKILKIGENSAELSYTDGQGRQTIRMSGQ